MGYDPAANLSTATSQVTLHTAAAPSGIVSNQNILATPTYNAFRQLTSAKLSIDGQNNNTYAVLRGYGPRDVLQSETDTGAGGATIYQYQTSLYPNASIQTLTDSLIGSWNYTYDTVNRLQSASASAGQYSSLTLNLSYDAFGNRTQEMFSGNPSMPVSPPPALSFTGNSLLNGASRGSSPVYNNQVDGLSYDASGNLIDDGNNQYLYDAEGRVCAVYHYRVPLSMKQYVYDALGNRVIKANIGTFNCDPTTPGFSPTNTYLAGFEGEQMLELDGNGNFQHANVFTNGQLTTTYSNDGNWYYDFNDWLGTKRVVALNGNWVEQCYSLPFGDSQSCNGGTDPSEQHYTGKERDAAESGNDYFGARYYASTMGRFTSPDPTFLNIRKVFNPQRWNLYSYGLNNPLGNIDPDGNEVIPVVYPNYQVGVRGSFTLPLGHAGVVFVERDGTTHYFEYGRYPNGDQSVSNGAVRNAGSSDAATPAVQRDASGNITQDSMNNLLQTLSAASGKGGVTDALVIPTTSAEDENIMAYLKARQAENGDPNREKYSLFGGHNCGTLACDTLAHAGMKTLTRGWTMGATPFANFLSLWALYGSSPAWEYQPKEHVTHRMIFPDGSN